jgi:UPF0271 protein
VIHDPFLVATRAVRMAVEHVVVADDGTVVACPVRSICVHGDTPGAVQLAGQVRAALGNVSAFVEPAQDQREP